MLPMLYTFRYEIDGPLRSVNKNAKKERNSSNQKVKKRSAAYENEIIRVCFCFPFFFFQNKNLSNRQINIDVHLIRCQQSK